VVRLQRKAMVRFFVRPRYIANAYRTGLFSLAEMADGGRLLLTRLLRGGLPSALLRNLNKAGL